MSRAALTQLTIFLSIGVIVVAAFWVRELASRRTPARRLKALEAEVKPKGGQVFQTVLRGTPVNFLLLNCRVYVIDAGGRELTRTKVLSPGFYFGLDVCTAQSIGIQGEYVEVFLSNRAIGAGGGNTSGGAYRSKDGRTWEKQTKRGWLPLDEAQP